MLAGGGAGRNHRSGRTALSRPGRDAGLVVVSAPSVGPALLPERAINSLSDRWFRPAPPPANIRCASGTKNVSSPSSTF